MPILFAQFFAEHPWTVHVSAFVAILALAALLIDWLGSTRSRTEQRLQDFKDPLNRKRREEGPGKRKNDAMARMLEASAPALAKPLQPKTEQAMSKLKLKLSYAGFRGEAAPQIFLMTKVVMLLIGIFICGGTTILLYGLNKDSLLRIGGTMITMFFL